MNRNKYDSRVSLNACFTVLEGRDVITEDPALSTDRYLSLLSTKSVFDMEMEMQ